MPINLPALQLPAQLSVLMLPTAMCCAAPAASAAAAAAAAAGFLMRHWNDDKSLAYSTWKIYLCHIEST
jgi:hypothetical protein